MENGIYQLRILSEGNSVEGIAVICENVINGGGGAYYCQGIVSQKDKALSGRIMIKKWDHKAHHALGLFKEVSLAVTGEYDPEKRSFNLQGQANGHHVIRVQATGHWIASPAKTDRYVHSK